MAPHCLSRPDQREKYNGDGDVESSGSRAQAGMSRQSQDRSLSAVMQLLKEWQYRSDIHKLHALSDRQLSDIGLTRGRIEAAVRGGASREVAAERLVPFGRSQLANRATAEDHDDETSHALPCIGLSPFHRLSPAPPLF